VRGLVFLAAESAVAIAVLEMFNYVAHYGLIRERDAGGRLEPFAPHHSWNSSNVLANPIIFNMGRHSDHHTRPSVPYQTLRYIAEAPELPAGYAGSILLALVPPLWRRVMDPKIQNLRA
jgi:alkane 1-monooxygenase